jgi:hypothetical protein
MAELNWETRATYYVDAFELALYLSSKIGNSVAIIDSENGRDYYVEVKKGPIERQYIPVLNMFLNSGYFSVESNYKLILRHAANMGWIEEGHYVFHVSW